MGFVDDLTKPLLDAINEGAEKVKPETQRFEKTYLPPLETPPESPMPGLPVSESTTPGQTYKFITAGVQPPSQLFIQEKDYLNVRLVTSQTSEILYVITNILIGNRIETITYQFNSTTATGIDVFYVPNLPEGFLLSLSLVATVATQRGQTYASVHLRSHGFPGGQFSQQLLAGYLTKYRYLSYPPAQYEDSLSGFGFNKPIQGILSTPLYESVVWGVPANRAWRWIGFTCLPIFSAIVATRGLYLTIGEMSAGSLLFFPHPRACVAGDFFYCTFSDRNTPAVQYAFAPGTEIPIVTGSFASMLQTVGGIARIQINNPQVGDEISSLFPTLHNAYVEEFLVL